MADVRYALCPKDPLLAAVPRTKPRLAQARLLGMAGAPGRAQGRTLLGTPGHAPGRAQWKTLTGTPGCAVLRTRNA